MSQSLNQPAYRLHKARNCAVVTLNGKNHYLGPWQSPESHEKYARLIAEWRRNNGVLPTPVCSPSGVLTINELVLAYFRFAQTRYVKYGETTSEVGCVRLALRPLRQLYGSIPATDFGPKALKDVRQAMIDAGRARKSINKDAGRIKRMFRWAVEEELLPVTTYERLRAVQGIGKGQTAAREMGKVTPVRDEHIEAVLPHLPPPVAAMVRLQLLTGTRPQEVMSIKPGEVHNRGDGIWLYSPSVHKTEHFGRDKVIIIGPQAQEVLKPWLDRDPASYCFVPAESVAWMRTRRRKRRRVSKQWVPPEGLNPRYTRHSYRIAVQRACVKAKVPVWSPDRLRHTRATQIRARPVRRHTTVPGPSPPGGRPFIRHLGSKHGFDRVLLLSGDRESEVRYLADLVGITEVHGGQSPEQKLERVRAETSVANTVFMGDGINDAPALTAATVGIAFGQNSDVTSEAAGAVILESSLEKVDEFLHIGARMRRVALQSAVGGMALSLIGMGVAAAGYLPPVSGAVLQELIGVAAVLNALRAAFPPRALTDY